MSIEQVTTTTGTEYDTVSKILAIYESSIRELELGGDIEFICTEIALQIIEVLDTYGRHTRIRHDLVNMVVTLNGASLDEVRRLGQPFLLRHQIMGICTKYRIPLLDADIPVNIGYFVDTVHGFYTVTNSLGQPTLIGSHIGYLLYYFLQENASNAQKYKATQGTIQIQQINDTLSITVSDDGIGVSDTFLQETCGGDIRRIFDTGVSGRGSTGIGLGGLNSRISELGGTIDAELGDRKLHQYNPTQEFYIADATGSVIPGSNITLRSLGFGGACQIKKRGLSLLLSKSHLLEECGFIDMEKLISIQTGKIQKKDKDKENKNTSERVVSLSDILKEGYQVNQQELSRKAETRYPIQFVLTIPVTSTPHSA